jgi:hypothetical protein
MAYSTTTRFVFIWKRYAETLKGECGIVQLDCGVDSFENKGECLELQFGFNDFNLFLILLIFVL